MVRNWFHFIIFNIFLRETGMNTKQEKLILESLFVLFNLITGGHGSQLVFEQKSKINDRIVEIQKEEIREKT